MNAIPNAEKKKMNDKKKELTFSRTLRMMVAKILAMGLDLVFLCACFY